MLVRGMWKPDSSIRSSGGAGSACPLMKTSRRGESSPLGLAEDVEAVAVTLRSFRGAGAGTGLNALPQQFYSFVLRGWLLLSADENVASRRIQPHRSGGGTGTVTALFVRSAGDELLTSSLFTIHYSLLFPAP